MLYLRNKSTSEIHCLDDDARSKEICNIDQIEDQEMLEEEVALRTVAANPQQACGHCWPKDEE